MTMRHNAVLWVSLSLLPAGGCTTATIEDAVPAAALETPAGEAAFSTPGDYPNLNVNPAPAATQLTDEERRQEADALRARRQQLAGQGGGSVRDSSAELRRLGERHASDALKEIEQQE